MSDSADQVSPVFSSADEQAFVRTASPSRPKRIWFLLCMLVALGTVYVLWNPRGEDRTRGRFHPAVGTTLRWTQLQPLLHTDASVVEEDVTGQVTLVNFWGPWCPPCREEFPKLMTLRDDFSKEPRFRLLSVACGAASDEPEEVLKESTDAYLAWLKLKPPIHVDRRAAFRQQLVSTTKMEDFSYPTTVLLDGRGVIRGIWVGYYEGEEEVMRGVISDLLGSSTSTSEKPQ